MIVTMMIALLVRMTASRVGNVLDVGIKHFWLSGFAELCQLLGKELRVLRAQREFEFRKGRHGASARKGFFSSSVEEPK